MPHRAVRDQSRAGITFVERGTRVLKGVPGERRLYAVNAMRP